MKKHDAARAISSWIFLLIFYWLYLDFMLSFFHIDFLVAMASDFGFLYSFDGSNPRNFGIVVKFRVSGIVLGEESV